jgi:uncharacterized Tic20 family protein
MSDNQDERLFAMLCHLSTFVAAIIGPLIIWVLKKDEYPLVDDQGKEVLNANISFFIYGFVAAMSMIILVGIILVPLLGIAIAVTTIIGAIRAYDGVPYRYPYIIRFIK